MSSPEHKQKIWDMIKDIRIGMLTTMTGDMLHARPMSLVQDDYDGTIWFYTERNAGKTAEIQDDQHICLTFVDRDKETYVCLSGTARLTQDKNLIDQFWNPFVSAWFPKGRDDPNLAMLEIKIQHGEHWDSTSSRMVQLYEVLKANVTHKHPQMGEHQTF